MMHCFGTGSILISRFEYPDLLFLVLKLKKRYKSQLKQF